MEFIFLLFSFVFSIYFFYFFLKIFISKLPSQNPPTNQNSVNNQFSLNEDFNKGLSQLFKDLKIEIPTQNHQKQVSNVVYTSKSSIKNLDVEAFERIKQKEEAVKNQKVKNIEAEALEEWKKKKEQLKNRTYRNIEKESLENAKLKKTKKKIEIQLTKSSEELIKPPQKKSTIQKLYQSKNDLKKAFLLQEILNKPEF